MKKDKETCKKGHESTIGKIIYGFLLFLPLMAIGVTCSYAIFNKNAYQSYESKQDTSLQRITNYQSLVIGETYTLSNLTKPETGNAISPIFYSNNADEYIKSFPHTNHSLTYVGFSFMTTSNQNNFVYGYTDYDTTTYATEDHAGNLELILNTLPFTFKLDNLYTQAYNYNNVTNFQIYRNFTHKIELSEIFYHSIEKIEQSNLFNWTKNSIIYTGMTEFTTSLSISNTFIPLLLTYWLIISIVYFLYDIVLVMLNVLHRKVHELQDSI